MSSRILTTTITKLGTPKEIKNLIIK